MRGRGGWRSCCRLAALNQDAVLEPRAGADQGDQVGSGDRAPPVLGGLDELEHHGEGGGRASGAAGDLGAELDGGERRLDRVRGPQVDPVLGREVVERQQFLLVVGDLRDGLGPLGAVGLRERLDRLLGVRACPRRCRSGAGLRADRGSLRRSRRYHCCGWYAAALPTMRRHRDRTGGHHGPYPDRPARLTTSLPMVARNRHADLCDRPGLGGSAV